MTVLELTRVDKLTRTYTLATLFPTLTGFSTAGVALLPRRVNPVGGTVFTSLTISGGNVTVTYAGPDASSAGAVVVTAPSDAHIEVTTTDGQVATAKAETLLLSGGGTITPLPTTYVTSVVGQSGVVSGGQIAADPALKAAYAPLNAAQVDLCSGPYNLRPGDDATAALQAALDSIGTTPQSTDIYFSRPGTYTLNGALKTGAALGYTWNGQVLIPAIGPQGTTIAIRIRGSSPISVGGSSRPAGGTKLLSNATAGWIVDCKPSYTAFGAANPWTNVWLSFEDIIIEAPTNPQCSGIKAQICSHFSTRNVAIQSTNFGSSTKTGSGEAISFPQNLNEDGGFLEHTVIAGWPKGMRLTEHATLVHLMITYCGSAFVATSGSHLNRFTHVGVWQTPTVFTMENADGQGSPVVVHGDLSYEMPSGTPAMFVDQPQPGCITGSLTVDFANPIGSPRITQGLAWVNGLLDLTNVRLAGARSWTSTHPSDNFQRLATGVSGIGLAWPTLHPWFLNAGSFQVNGTHGSPGALVSTASGVESMALIPIKDGETGGRSRVISATFTLGATTPHVKLVGNYVFGGANNTNMIFIDATPTHLYLLSQIGNVNSTLADGGALLTAGQTYTISLEIGLNAMGRPTTVASYLNGSQISTATLPSATSTALAPGDYPPRLLDGVVLSETGSQLTKFVVRDR